jgi:serine phosphatase RsbU (regulator of sigma subunit)/anti-sigma regulatory factor (Ser/Thr protein kinase)
VKQTITSPSNDTSDGGVIKSEKNARKSMERYRQSGAKKGLGLQVRMTFSYLGMTVVIVLLSELLIVLAIFTALTQSAALDKVALTTTRHTAQVYALEAGVQASGATLDARTTFQPGRPASIALPGGGDLQGGDPTIVIPYIDTQVPYIAPHQPTPKLLWFALLIAPNGQVLASSWPERYPASTLFTGKLTDKQQVQLVQNALAGKDGSTIATISQASYALAAEPVLSREKHVIGAIYVQVPVPSNQNIFQAFEGGWIFSGLAWLFIITPVGVFFGLMTTRGLVRRVHRLVKATAQFATGDYTQRVAVSRRDEIGQLELQFNQMAEQLVESIARQQALTEQNARMEERARIEQELRTAQYIQKSLLPKEVPELTEWRIARYYHPAREVGGDFYDFHPFEDGRLGVVIGDATDKGVSAALLMATTCTMLRTAAQRATSPCEVLTQVNDLLYANIPSGMFATCFYAILDPESGRLRYANAGHEWPYRRYSDGVSELQATGMPLGMMPGTRYDEQEVTLAPGESLLLYSDGLVEAHNAQRDMFDLPRLKTLIGAHPGGIALIDSLLKELTTFAGENWEQEDDVTLIALQRAPASPAQDAQEEDDLRLLSEWAIPSAPDNERQAVEQVAAIAQSLQLSGERLESFKTAVGEATMNAMEHGNHYQPDKPVVLQVLASQKAIAVRICDQGERELIIEPDIPDLQAKLAGQQAPRGWGLFLIKNLVDELHVTNEAHAHTVEMIMYREETPAEG